jgi:Glu-tRNA(Gln) amidotransferase subunit E-like FAD-binding protein
MFSNNFLLQKEESGEIIFNLNNNEKQSIINRLREVSNENYTKEFKRILHKMLKHKQEKMNNIVSKNGTITKSLNDLQEILHPKIIKKLSELSKKFGDLFEHDSIEHTLQTLINLN